MKSKNRKPEQMVNDFVEFAKKNGVKPSDEEY